MQAIAIYDMDETITRRPTLLPFLLSVSFRLAPWRVLLLPAVGATVAGYLLGAVDRARLKELNQRWLLGDTVDPKRLDGPARRFARRTVAEGLKPGAIRQIARRSRGGQEVDPGDGLLTLLRRGDRGVAEVRCRDRNGGHIARQRPFQPAHSSGNCYGPGKAAKIVDWMATNGVAREDIHLTMYSDHISDIPSFELADEAVVVDPAPELRMEAERRGWRVVDWS